jgi:formate dehydrogenase iron-sulfur subunit
MEINRRDFLKASAGAAGLLLLKPPALALAKETQTNEGMAMLVDVTKCVSCWWCYAACRKYNNLPETSKPNLEQPPPLSADVCSTLFPVKRGNEWHTRKLACNHCTEATCVEVCPTGALSYNELGFVQYDRTKCSGCGYCSEYCPFGVPQMESNLLTGAAVMHKCTFCKDRITSDQKPACAAACPTGALTFGKRTELVKEGKERTAALSRSNASATFYGENELGGLHVMYVLNDSPEVYGLPVNPEVPPPATVCKLFQWIASGLGIAAIAGFGLNYIIARKRLAGKGRLS